MKQIITFVFLIFTLSLSAAKEPIKVAVPQFEDKSGENNCRNSNDQYWYWKNNLGKAFREMLMGELAEHRRFRLLERERINKMYQEEFELVNSSEAKKRKRGGFQSADYQLVGAVTQFEYCAEGDGAKVNLGGLGGLSSFGGFSLGAKKSAAKVVVQIRAIDVHSGVIVASASGEAKSSDTKFDVGVDFGVVDFDVDKLRNTPLGQVSQEAIQEAFRKLERKLD